MMIFDAPTWKKHCEDIIEGENAGNQLFFLFLQCVLSLQDQILIF